MTISQVVFNFSVDLWTFFVLVAHKEFFIFWRICPAGFPTLQYISKLGHCSWNTGPSVVKHRMILNLLRHQPSGRFLNENLLSLRIVLSVDLVAPIPSPSHFAEFCSQASGLAQISLNLNFFSLSLSFATCINVIWLCCGHWGVTEGLMSALEVFGAFLGKTF